MRFCQFSVNGCCLKFIVSLCSSSCNSILVVPNEWIVCSYLAYWYLAHWIQQSIPKQQIPFFFSIFFSTKKQGTHQGSGNDIRIFRVPNLLSTWSNVKIMCRNDELNWLFTNVTDSELFILFAENSQILLKISVFPILLTFIYLVALNLLVNL